MPSQTNSQRVLHEKISRKRDLVRDWFISQRKGYAFPFYMSFDVRDSGHKVAPVDANIYPAGFNNICPTDREASSSIIEFYLKSHYGKEIKNICLLAEEHTANLFYWDNVRVLKEILESSGREVRVSIPRDLNRPFVIKAASGAEIEVLPFSNLGFIPDIIISNNDFSDSKEEWAQDIKIPINPPRQLGWYQRRKSTHFKYYNELAADFAKLIDVDPWMIQVQTDVMFDCDLAYPENRERAAQKADQMLSQLREVNRQRGIKEEPFLFVKNNSGTYGLAVAQVRNGEEILSWNSKARTKMKASKGGHGVTELLFQEGIPTTLTIENETCEPAIYMIGCELVGGFLRAHGEKGPTESLNSPGAVYKKLCVTDLKVDIDGSPMENVYGWVSKISSLAIGREAREMGVVYTDFNVDGSCPSLGRPEHKT